MKLRITALALCVIASAAIAQTTRLVPSQYPTIQAAINASINGDTVLVSPGVYPGAISFVGKLITVTSSGGAAVTTILGSTGIDVVSFATNEGPTAVLNGFTITGGAGVLIQNSSPTIQNCRITNNARSGPGGGVFATTTGAGIASPTITGCRIANNVSLMPGTTANVGAGGICFDGGSTTMSFPIVTNCVIESNVAIATGGGGIAVVRRMVANFVGCQIRNNSCPADGGGALLYSVGFGSVTFTSCVFSGNQAGIYGGAAFSNDISLTFVSCLMTENVAGDNGGAVYFATGLPGVSLTVMNCTIVGNTANVNTGGIFKQNSGTPTININNTICWGNSGLDLWGSGAAVTYSDIGFGVFTPGVGTFSADPILIDPLGGDFHLTTISPCRDAGAPGTVGLPSTDMDGATRIVGTAVDIGADELPVLAFPGTTDGLDLYGWINSAGDPLASTRPAAAGQLVTALMKSATGALVGGNPVFAAQLYVNGAPPFVFLSTVWTDSGAVIVYGDFAAPPFGFPGLPPDGLDFNFTVPAGLAGTTVRMQGFVISVNALNGIFATSNATEVTF